MWSRVAQRVGGVLFATLFLFLSCAKRDFKLLSEEEMVNLLTEFYLTEGSLDVMFIRDEQKKNLYYNSLFQKYHVTRRDFEKSAAYYAKDAKDLELIYEAVIDSLKSKELLVASNYYHPQEIEPTTKPVQMDTLNLWLSERRVVWHPDSLRRENELPFEFSDSNYFAQGDKFVLYFLQSTAWCDSLCGAYAEMYVRYSNNEMDSVSAMLIPDERVRRYRLSVNNPDSLRPVAVYGNLLCCDTATGIPDRWFDSIAVYRIFDANKNPLPDSLKALFLEEAELPRLPQSIEPTIHRNLEIENKKIRLKQQDL